MGFIKDHQKTQITKIIEACIKNKDLNYKKFNKILELIDLKDEKTIYEQQQNLMECCRCIRKSLKYGFSLNERVLALEMIDYIIENLDPEEIDNENFIKDLKLNENLKLAYIGKPYAWNKMQKAKEIKDFQDKTVAYVTQIWNKKYSQFNAYTELYIEPENNFFDKERARSFSSASKKQPVKISKKKDYLKDKADPSVLPEDLQYGIPIINAKALSSKINQIVADSNKYTTLLDNRLTELIKNVCSNEDELATEYFINVRNVRRKVLRYLQLVTDGEFLGLLLKCNDDMVVVLDRYDFMSNLTDEDENQILSEISDNEEEPRNSRPRRDISYFTDSDDEDDRRSVHSTTNPFEDAFHI
ncbi:hypothetical protein QEN19_002937 [Hanseniaspora menglaensis]